MRLTKDAQLYVFGLLPISTKRVFLRVCHEFNKMVDTMPRLEAAFEEMIREQNFLGTYRHFGYHYPLFKYTVEL